MIGRYGTDGLNQFLSMSSIVMLLVSLLTRVSLFTWLGAALLILCYYRSLSRNISKRTEENYKFYTIKDRITRSNPRVRGDDLPYLLAISRDCPVDLEHEYRGILTMFEDPSGETATAPLRAFFGEMTAKPRRRKSYPLALLNNKVNLDQLLAINNAMRYPLAYVQGPPGTGKTNTIVNTLTTAFFNERTVLFSSYNNHPIDGVVEKLQAVTYHGQTVPFPILRLGNNEKTAEALRTIDQLFEQCKKIPVPERLLDKNHADRTARAKQLTALLERYERILDLRERRETIRRLLDARGQMNFQYELQAGPPTAASTLPTRWLCWTATRTSCCATSTTPRPAASAGWRSRNITI